MTDSISSGQAKELIVKSAFLIIENDQDLNIIAHAIAILKEQYPNQNIKMFDFKGLKELKEELFFRNNWSKSYKFKIEMFGNLPFIPDSFISDDLKKELDLWKEKRKKKK